MIKKFLDLFKPKPKEHEITVELEDPQGNTVRSYKVKESDPNKVARDMIKDAEDFEERLERLRRIK